MKESVQRFSADGRRFYRAKPSPCFPVGPESPVPQPTRFIHLAIVLLTALTLSFSDLPLRPAEAGAAESKPAQSANAKTQKSSAPKKGQSAKTGTSSQKNARAGKKSAARPSAPSKQAGAKKRSGNRKSTASAAKIPYKGAVVFNNSTGQVIYSSNPNRKVPPASLTKILSMYVAEDAMRARKIKRNTLVTVSAKAAAARGSRMGLSAGDRVPLEDLLHGMAVSSGNDASIAVAEFIGGSERKFVQMMNQKARSLGMSRSTFVNSSGLPAPGQFTTAKDMLALARSYLAAYPGNLHKHHNHAFNSYRGNMTSNANPLLRGFQGADGLKTGFVSAAGYNLIATAQRNGQRVIGVILGAPSSAMRATEAYSIMEASFNNPARLTVMSGKADLAAVSGKATPRPAPTATAANSKNRKQAVQTADSSKPSRKQSGKKAAAKPSKAGSPSVKNKKAASGSAAKKTADKKQKSRKVSFQQFVYYGMPPAA